MKINVLPVSIYNIFVKHNYIFFWTKFNEKKSFTFLKISFSSGLVETAKLSYVFCIQFTAIGYFFSIERESSPTCTCNEEKNEYFNDISRKFWKFPFDSTLKLSKWQIFKGYMQCQQTFHTL